MGKFGNKHGKYICFKGMKGKKDSRMSSAIQDLKKKKRVLAHFP